MKPRMLLITITGLLLSTYVAYSNQINVQDNTPDLCAPIQFSPVGINTFLKHTYNHPLYSKEILPNNLFHLTQFLEHGKKNKPIARLCKICYQTVS